MSEIRVGDMRVVLAEMESDFVDSCVTDPPYHLTSIVKRFGADGAAPAKSGKTGVYARSSKGFMGKTWDGGDIAFRPETWAEVLRVLKPGGHLLAFAAAKNAHRMFCAVEDAGFEIRDCIMWLYSSGFPKSHNLDGEWKGWGTALKPAYEPILVARKPLSGTVAQNVEKHGVGAINIEDCRVDAEVGRPWRQPAGNGVSLSGSVDGSLRNHIEDRSDMGRWPANIIHDGSAEVLATFPDAPGQQRSVGPENAPKSSNVFGDYGPRDTFNPRGDSGSAARFFYCAKAAKKDRNEGCEGLPPSVENHHPTVKPTELMRYLCRLVTPPGGLVLDPFCGSGSTGKAAALEGFRFVGIEMDKDYAAIAQQRIWHAQGMGWLA